MTHGLMVYSKALQEYRSLQEYLRGIINVNDTIYT